VLGYVESTQATAGTWATSPSKTQLFGPGVKRPGDTVQEVTSFVSASAATSSATYVALTNENVTIAVTSAANLVRAEAFGKLTEGATINVGLVRLSRGTVANTNLFGNEAEIFGLNGVMPSALFGYDQPNAAGSITYAVQGQTSFGILIYGGNTQLKVREIAI
jgi:hypothetical protein